MSVEEIRWAPWLDDFDRIVEDWKGAIDVLADDLTDKEAIETIKVELHSAKGLLDSVGLKTSTQTIFELEETVHSQGETLTEDTLEMLRKAYAKLIEMVIVIRDKMPKPEEVTEIDQTLGFEAILVKFGREFHVEIEIKADRSLKSARALGIYNQIKRISVIKHSEPPEEDLYLDAKFDVLILDITSRDHQDDIQEKIAKLPGVGSVTVEAVAAVEEKLDETEEIAKNLTIRVPLSQIRAIEAGLASLSAHVEALKSEVLTSRGIEELSGIDRAFERIQGDLRKMRKVPLDSITTTFPVMVTRLAKQEKKEAELLVQGRFITLDRSLANHLIDPITQLIRNSISHGLETPAQRKKAGKPPVGRIVINARNDRDKIQIQVSDDGKGLDRDKIINKAKELNLPVSKNPTDYEIQEAIFNRGFSLANRAETELSGRGIGLFSAKERLAQIGGTITVSSEQGKGTTFTIEISDPDALSKNLIFTINEGTYGMPTSEVEQVLIVNPTEIQLESDTRGTIEYLGEKLPVAIARNIIGQNSTPYGLRNSNEILLVCRGKRSLVGIVIDKLLDERLVNIRPLNKLLQSYEFFSGTLSGRDREVILVVNPAAII